MHNQYLFIGPKKNIANPDMIGGVIVLFENLLAYCNKYDIKYAVIDTNKSNYKNRLFAYVHILFLMCVKVPKTTHVSLHGTANDYLLIAPFALGISKIFNKHFSLRKFAGNFIEIFKTYSPLQKKIIETVLTNSSCNFFETKYLVDYFQKYNTNTYWFPNVREKPTAKTTGEFKKRFIYLGAIKEEKGIDILCEASCLLSEDYHIDLYGTLYDRFTENYFNSYNLTYKGKLHPEDVPEILSHYDVLVLPSFREGYPGVIIEAFSVGLPIVATNLQGIVEMTNEKSSILVEPKNVKQLAKAMQKFNEVNYSEKSLAAREQFNYFDSQIQTRLYFEKYRRVLDE